MTGLPSLVLIAQSAPAAPGIGQMLIPLILVMGVFWLLIWRPQAKAQAKHQELLKSLKVGDEVVTDAGVYGKITSIDERRVTLEIAKGVKMKMRRANIEGFAEIEGESEEKK